MKTRWFIAASLLWVGAGCAFQSSAADAAETKEGEGQLTDDALRGMVAAFADRAGERIVEASRKAQAFTSSDRVRLRCQRMGAGFYTSLVAAAVRHDAPSGLLDTIVAVSLERWIISSPRGTLLYGPDGARFFRTALAPLERDAWAMGAQAFPPEQLQELRGMIEGWKRENPRALSARLVRFEEFARRRPDSSLAQEESRGLLAPVKDVNKQVTEIRRMAERVLFLVQRVPTLARWQGTDLIQETLISPQVTRILNQYDPDRILGDVDGLVRGWINLAARRTVQTVAAFLGLLLLYKLLRRGFGRAEKTPPPAPSLWTDRRRPHSAGVEAGVWADRRGSGGKAVPEGLKPSR